MTFALSVVFLVACAGIGVLAGMYFASKRPKAIYEWPLVRRIFRRDAPVRCMGFDLVDRGGPLPRVADCHRMLTEKNVHLVATVFEGESENEVHTAEEGTAVLGDFCQVHCPGGCNRGCSEPSKEDKSAKNQKV